MGHVSTIIALIFFNVTDYISTYLVTPDLSLELHPAVSLFNFGWTGLIISMSIPRALIIIGLNYYLHKAGNKIEIENKTSTRNIFFLLKKLITKSSDNNFKYIERYFYFTIVAFYVISSHFVATVNNLLIWVNIYIANKTLQLISIIILSWFLTFLLLIHSTRFWFKNSDPINA